MICGQHGSPRRAPRFRLPVFCSECEPDLSWRQQSGEFAKTRFAPSALGWRRGREQGTNSLPPTQGCPLLPLLSQGPHQPAPDGSKVSPSTGSCFWLQPLSPGCPEARSSPLLQQGWEEAAPSGECLLGGLSSCPSWPRGCLPRVLSTQCPCPPHATCTLPGEVNELGRQA